MAANPCSVHVCHVAFQPGVSSLGIQEVQLKDQRTACESDSDSKPAGGHTGTLGFDTGSEAYQQQVAFTRTLG